MVTRVGRQGTSCETSAEPRTPAAEATQGVKTRTQAQLKASSSMLTAARSRMLRSSRMVATSAQVVALSSRKLAGSKSLAAGTSAAVSAGPVRPIRQPAAPRVERAPTPEPPAD